MTTLASAPSNTPDSDLFKGCEYYLQELSGFDTVRLLEAEPGCVKLCFEVTEGNRNRNGKLQGGFMFTVMDMASGMLAYSCGRTSSTMQANINYLKPGHGGVVTLEGHAEHCGGKTVFNRVDAYDEKGTCLAMATFTMFLFDKIR